MLRSGHASVVRATFVGGCVAIILATLALAPASVALSRAPYRVERFALARDLGWDELPWTHEKPLGFPARKPRDAKGVPLVPCHDGRLVYPMGMLSINGMKRLDTYTETGDRRQLDQTLAMARRLRVMAREIGNAWWLPHTCSYAPENQDAPWWNAMTQGLAVSFFVRLYHVTGKEDHLEVARRIAGSLFKLDRRNDPWVSFVGSDRSLWLEHYPRPAPSHVLNAHLHALFGLYELWDATRDRAVRRLLEGAITTMRDHLSRFRRPGQLSFYDLGNRTAHVHYHAIHVWQVRFLARISGDRYFWRMADRLERDSKPSRSVPGRPRIQLRPPAVPKG